MPCYAADLNVFFENRDWDGGNAFYAYLRRSFADVVMDPSVDQLLLSDVVVVISPSVGMFSQVNLESLANHVKQIVIFDEKIDPALYFDNVSEAYSKDQKASHINGLASLPVLSAEIERDNFAWNGRLAFNHPAPIEGIQMPVVGDESHAYVISWSSNVWIVRDASMLTNMMFSMYDNRSFVKSLLLCEGSCRAVVYSPDHVIAESMGIIDKLLKEIEALRTRFDNPKDPLHQFPWRTVFEGILLFWLILGVLLAFSWSRK